MKTYVLKMNYALKTNPDEFIYIAGDVISMSEAADLIKDDKYVLSVPVTIHKCLPANEAFIESPWSD